MSSPNTINLHGIWKLRCEARGIEVDYPVPGDVHSALIAAGQIPDPYKGTNELACRWVADEEWVASRTFELDVVEGEWQLDIDYLDTVATVKVNGADILKAENCFRRYQPNVAQHLRKGENTVDVILHSNTKAANTKQAEQPFYIPYHAGNCPIPNGNMLRKPQCHFGWDWNLAIVPFGLCGKFSLGGPQALKREVFKFTFAVLEDGSAKISVFAYAPFDVESGTRFILEMAGHQTELDAIIDNRNALVRGSIVISQPKFWWPNGSGDQHLYDATICFGDHTFQYRIGIRQIELCSLNDSAGKSFEFKINGRKIFCRGANWIPADALPSRSSPALTRKLLQAAVDANMNMIRVWGGGYYEQDWFYDLCDELGLLVWQDFQFSCNLYPSTPEFIWEVVAEVEDQVERLNKHPSIALWCGDNELIGALNWFDESRNNRDRYLVNYDRLNRSVENAAKSAADGINWWPSSPSPGVLDFGDAWHDDSKGDMHFWSVWHEGRDFEHYYDVKPRFCSEFGFQSFPSLRICKEFVESEEDLNISSAVMEHHQRNKGGNARIAETMFRYFRFPMDFGNFVYLSQVQQGLAMRMAVEYWRSLKPHCMGTLYWQLNDTWPVASWSGLDHGGGWKLLHYMARDFYAPVSVVAIPNKDKSALKLIAINDTLEKTEVFIDLRIVMMDGRQHILPNLAEIVPTEKAVEIASIAREDIPEGAILFWTFGDIRRHFAFERYKHLELPAPGISTSVKLTKRSLEITVHSRGLALYVSLECDVAGHFSDNAFDLLAGESITITFTPDTPSDLKRAASTIVIRDLYSSSH